MNEDTLWLTFWKGAAAVLCTLIVVTGSYCSHNDYRRAQALQSGVDPLAIECALGANSTGTPCAIMAAKR